MKKREIKSKFDVIDMEQLRKLAPYHDDHFLASFYGVTVATWRYWKKKHPRFFVDLRKWKNEVTPQVERALFRRAVGFEKVEMVFEKTGNLTAMQDTETEDIVFHDEYRKSVKVTTMAPDTAAIALWLTNVNPEEWAVKSKNEGPDNRTLGERVLNARKRLRLLPAPKEEVEREAFFAS